MPVVQIPGPMQSYTGGHEVVDAGGRNVRQLIEELDRKYPGIRSALMTGDKLKPDVAVAIDGEIARLGLLEPLQEDTEVVFLPAIAGG